MADDSRTQDASTPITRWKVVGGSVSTDEFEEVEQAVRRAGYKNRSAFVRETVLERARHINAAKRRSDDPQDQAAA